MSVSNVFQEELGYFRSLGLDVIEHNIAVFLWNMEASVGVPSEMYNVEYVMNQEFRDIVKTGKYWGASVDPKASMRVGYVHPDMCFDAGKSELWVVGYAEENDYVIYVWSPSE